MLDCESSLRLEVGRVSRDALKGKWSDWTRFTSGQAAAVDADVMARALHLFHPHPPFILALTSVLHCTSTIAERILTVASMYDS